jgi:hypothetical protein
MPERKPMSKKDLLKTAKSFGFSTDKGLRQLAFVFKDLYSSQVVYSCIDNANNWLRNNHGLSISIFYEENEFPCIRPDFARFHVSESTPYTGDLVATSFKTLNSVLNSTRAQRMYYIQDLEYTRSWFGYDIKRFNDVMNDTSIIKLVRSRDHLEKLRNDGYNDVSPIIVPDFNINLILEIIDARKNRKA